MIKPLMKFSIPQTIRDSVARSLVHHWTETMKLSRLAMAKNQCIDESQVSDFPASNTSTHVSNHSVLSTAVTAAAVLGGVGLGAAGMQTLAPSPQPNHQPDPVIVTPAPPADPARAKIELYYDDPERGLVPITGAASAAGATLTPK